MSLDWSLLCTFEAVARLGSVTAAAKALGVSQSTVSRHLDRLEAEARSPLVTRERPVRLTERGARLLASMGPMVEGALAARSALEDQDELVGEVTISTVAEILRWELSPRLPELLSRHPLLRLRVLTGNSLVSLAAGEADIALRLRRPETGDLLVRRVGQYEHALFLAVDVEAAPGLPWLGLTGSLAGIPEQLHAARAFPDRPPRLLVEDVESLALAVAAGLGVAILPRGLAARVGGLREVGPEEVGAQVHGPVASRALWLVVHRARHKLPRVRAVVRWLLGEEAPDAAEQDSPSQTSLRTFPPS
ncbi:MAG: LysR family transcriptional regulator [Deltaproteobacteria bacterium]|nr:LysR family transcriptional regulator [Deltaproteobacteria bacterium]